MIMLYSCRLVNMNIVTNQVRNELLINKTDHHKLINYQGICDLLSIAI